MGSAASDLSAVEPSADGSSGLGFERAGGGVNGIIFLHCRSRNRLIGLPFAVIVTVFGLTRGVAHRSSDTRLFERGDGCGADPYTIWVSTGGASHNSAMSACSNRITEWRLPLAHDCRRRERSGRNPGRGFYPRKRIRPIAPMPGITADGWLLRQTAAGGDGWRVNYGLSPTWA